MIIHAETLRASGGMYLINVVRSPDGEVYPRVSRLNERTSIYHRQAEDRVPRSVASRAAQLCAQLGKRRAEPRPLQYGLFWGVQS